MFLISYMRLHQNYYYLRSGSPPSSAISIRNEAPLWPLPAVLQWHLLPGWKPGEYATRGNSSCKTPIALVFVVKVNPACKEYNLLIILCQHAVMKKAIQTLFIFVIIASWRSVTQNALLLWADNSKSLLSREALHEVVGWPLLFGASLPACLPLNHHFDTQWELVRQVAIYKMALNIYLSTSYIFLLENLENSNIKCHWHSCHCIHCY